MTVRVKWAAWVVFGVGVVAGSYLVAEHNYLLFHSLVELASVVVGVLLFTVAARMFSTVGHGYLMVLGIGFFWAAVIDTVHLLAYKGMGVFPGGSAHLPTELWILARYVQAGTVLLATVYLTRRLKRRWVVFAAVGAVAVLGLVAVFSGKFPACYIDGVGLTQFKVVSEYVISAMLLVSLGVLVLRRERLDRWTFRSLGLALGLTIAAELAFTRYVSVYGPTNVAGHVLKLAAYTFILTAVLHSMLTAPVRAMRRLTPICASCKSVRAPDGTWSSIETFLTLESGNDLTHGVCPTCLKELYPEFADEVGGC